jgi:Protein of unknown function (DUF3300)
MNAAWAELPIRTMRNLVAIICAAILMPGDMSVFANPPSPQTAPAAEEAARIPAEQLDSLVAPIALYPDPMLSQTLVASTYPLEIIQLQQWLEKNKGLKDKALADAVKKQDWDPSIQAMAALPEVVKQMSENIKWTTDLGNAFLAQQGDVMDAVQRMRKKANDSGNLKSSEQQKVETKVVESKQVIVIEQANPQVVYVPSYNPTVVYGAPVYPYPPIAYPPVGYYAAGMAISFGVGMAMGAAWGGGWGYNNNWGGGNNNININNNNTFVNNSNRQNVNNRQNTANRSGGNTWQHNPQHRGGAPYSNKATANQYGGTARGDSMSSRQTQARQNQSQRTGQQQAGAGNRSASGTRPQGSAADRSASGNRGAGAASTSANRGGGGGGGAGAGASGDRVGNRTVPSGGGSRSSSGLSGGAGGYSGSSARSSSSRGSSSMGGSRGGGGRRR